MFFSAEVQVAINERFFTAILFFSMSTEHIAFMVDGIPLVGAQAELAARADL